ncbi:MoaD/ThiS family protein [Paludibaculum fermentans]|uniref:MoaD/ThiS family protein n=1 Tax=Paludibaculum fermentans TaxID=1473598 RepID=UPI003EBFA4D4
MIRVELPAHLRNLAGVQGEIQLDLPEPVTIGGALDALEARFPMLGGTMRDHVTRKRRDLLRFFVCGEDWSHEPHDTPLPASIATGVEPLIIIGAIAGG